MKRFQEFRLAVYNAIRVGWFLALRQIGRSSKWTTSLTVFIMVLTFLNLVVVSGLLVGLMEGALKTYADTYAGDVLVTVQPGTDYIENSPQLLSFVQNHPAVSVVSPRVVAGAQVQATLDENPEKNEKANKIGARVLGVDLENEEKLSRFSRFVKYGENLAPGDEGYVLIGSMLIKKYSTFADANVPGLELLRDVEVGSRVRISITGDDGVVRSKDFTVKGIVKTKADELSGRVFMHAAELRRMLPGHQNEYQEMAIRVTDSSFAPTLVKQMKEFQGDNKAQIQTLEQAIPSFLRDIKTTMGILGNALSSIALVVASITIFIVVFINAVTRRKFIGIMKGIGISPWAIQFSYILQAIFYGTLGSAIGLFLTFALLKPYFDANPIDFPFADGILVATPLGALVRIIILLVVTFFAGYLPAKLIVRKNTLDSILGR